MAVRLCVRAGKLIVARFQENETNPKPFHKPLGVYERAFSVGSLTTTSCQTRARFAEIAAPLRVD